MRVDIQTTKERTKRQDRILRSGSLLLGDLMLPHVGIFSKCADVVDTLALWSGRRWIVAGFGLSICHISPLRSGVGGPTCRWVPWRV